MGKGLFEGWHLVILIVLLILLFGFKRLPDAARSLGRSMRVFKSEVDELKNENRDRSEASRSTVPGETVREDAPASDPAADEGPVRESTPRTDNNPG